MSKCEQCIIRQLNSLNELTRDELLRVSACKTSEIIKKGTLIFDEGSHINGVYCIKEGVAKVSKMSSNGKDQILKLVKKGDIIGERSLVSNEASNLKAIAINDMELCFIPKEEIVRDLKKNSNFSMKVLQDLSDSLKNSDNAMVDMAQKTVKQRLAETLLYLNKNFRDENTGLLDISLSRDDIANMIGTATESAIRLLSELKKQNVISLKGKEIKILDATALKKIAEGY